MAQWSGRHNNSKYTATRGRIGLLIIDTAIECVISVDLDNQQLAYIRFEEHQI